MTIQVASPSSHSFIGESKCRYDVFLSYRGEDTRHNFTVPLYNALQHEGIKAFIDDKKLGKGRRIAPALLKAIERSRISIIVFSTNYATSTWCLDELAHIIRCKNEKNQRVMPIFYNVDPMIIQYQRESFEAAMAAHEDRFRDDPKKVQKWRSALSEAASLSKAWLFKDGYELFGFIERIIKDACAMLPAKRLHSPQYTVGLEPRMEQVISLLNQSHDRVSMLGIYGTGGIGKTTLAISVYKSIFYQFEGACFLFDVGEASTKYQGIVNLQRKLLSEILDEKFKMIGSVDEGITRIKHRLSHKKVLLVFDNVDEVEQLEQLTGGCDWFGYGSKVIITTREKQLLISHNVKNAYEMMKMNEHDSLELFCWHAFRITQPPKNYQDMSSCAVGYAQGLPLALGVIGSNLANKNLEEWMPILERYERIQEITIYEVLKISYDCLQDGAKRIFLDIACFVDKNMFKCIEEIVEACDSGARFYLEVLIDKSLITFVANKCLYIHDLIQQMGREIVRQEAPLNPEKRSRLWYYKDVLKVLLGNLKCNNMEGIKLDPPQQKKVKWSSKAFKKMDNLRILIIQNVQFLTGPTYLPNSLRWLEWEGYPSTTLPIDFSPSELVFLKLPRSSLRMIEPLKIFTIYMTKMDFPHCEFITEIPDMSELQSLKRLNLPRCSNLIKVHESVGSLSKLVQLDVSFCTKLSSFPREIKMPSLVNLNLGYCESLEYFPHVVGNMDALYSISMEGTAIKELPPSIGNLSSLLCLYMKYCKSLGELPTNLFTLPNLSSVELGGGHPRTRKSWVKLMEDNQPIIFSYHMMTLHLIDCDLRDEELHLILSCFRNLQQLNISRNDFVSLPKCIKQCAQLLELDVSDCKSLRDIPELPSNLCDIVAENCTSLTAESLDNLYLQGKKELCGLDIRMPRSTTFPDWYNYWCKGGTLSFRVRRNFPHAALAFELKKANMSYGAEVFLDSMSINGRKIILDHIDFYYRRFYFAPSYVWLDDLSELRIELQKELSPFKGMDWNDVELQFICDPPHISIERCGVYVYKQQTDMEDIQFIKSPLVSTNSLKRKAIVSPPNDPPKKKFLRKIKVAHKGNMNNTSKRTRISKRHQTFRSCSSRNMVFPIGTKLIWRFLCH